jgi:hypothetical protein
MTTQIYICPKCGCPDLEEPQRGIALSATERTVKCPNCNWGGTLSEAAGILTTEKVYDTQAVADLLMYTTLKHAAGPLAQALLYVGLLEKGDQDGLDKVMRATVEAVVRESLMAAATHAAEKGTLEREVKVPGKIWMPGDADGS